MIEDPAIEHLPVAFYQQLPENDRQLIVRTALAHLRQTSSDVKLFLERAIRTTISIDGFKDPMRAPASILVQAVSDASTRIPSLAEAILELWIESQPELYKAASEFIDVDELLSSFHKEVEEQTEDVTSLKGEFHIPNGFQDEYPDYSEQDTILMFLCLAEQALRTPEHDRALSAPHEEATETSEPTDPAAQIGGEMAPRWQQWLTELAALPADAPEWDIVPGFIKNLQQLAEEKHQERVAVDQRLQQTLVNLIEQAEDELNYFDIVDVANWSIPDCSLDKIEKLSEQVNHLQEMLIEHQQLRQQATKSLAEERQRRSHLSELEDEILDLYEQLSDSLTLSPSQEPPPDPKPSLGEPEGEPEAETPSGEESAPPADTIDQDADPEPTPAVEIIQADKAEKPVIEAKETAGSEVPGEADPFELDPTLRSPKEITTLLKADDRPKYWHAFLWSLIAEDDLPAAYWLAKSLTSRDLTAPAPDWLLAAIQGARWLSPDSKEFANDLLEIATNHQPATDGASSDVQKMLGLAAALRPVLIAPYSGLIDWLTVPSSCPALHEVVTRISAFASRGIIVRPETLLGITGAEERQAKLRDTVSTAERWLQEAPQRRMKVRRAAAVWRHLTGPKGELYKLVLPVTEDRRRDVDSIRSHLERWRSRSDILNKIDQIDAELMGMAKPRPIVGAARKQLISGVREASQLVQQWCDAVGEERDIEARGDWLFEQVVALRNTTQAALPNIEVALSELSSLTQPASVAAAAFCLRRAIYQLCETLDLSIETSSESLDTYMWDWFRRDTDDLHVALSRRLLWLPNIPLDDDGQPLDHAVPKIASSLRDTYARRQTLTEAFEERLRNQDYRFVNVLQYVVATETNTEDFQQRYQDALEGSRAALYDNISSTQSAIEQAVVDGIIDEEQRAEYGAIVEAVTDEDVLNFPPKYERLRDVRESISAARQRRLHELRSIWEGLQEDLTDSHLKPAQQELVYEHVTETLRQKDTRVVEECLAHLTKVLDGGSEFEETLFSPPAMPRDELMEFTEVAPRIEEWLRHSKNLSQVASEIQRGRTKADISFRSAPKTRRNEAYQAIQAWRRLKQHRSPSDEHTPPAVATLLRYLGFTLQGRQGRAVEMEKQGRDWGHLRASMSASDLARPIPQFGSDARGEYDVVCLWERPGADTIAARLRELRLTRHSVLVLYLGRLTRRQRRDVTRVSRERGIMLAVLDETLLIYLAQERDARLPTFLRCALPFTALNPYTPFQAGDVPPEMFFGREVMAHELQDSAGSCLVFGGRQLGKSALLRHVQRQFHHPERERYAWIENMKLIFDPPAGKDTSNVWRTLRESFKRQGLLSDRITTEDTDKIRNYLRDAILESSERRVLVMFDEADDFLDADAKDQFRVVTALRELMLESARRFKVVFAGLHNVQRFQGIPNQPLAHFGAPLCVGPLEPARAQDLIREPLETLGFRFADEGAVLRILSYTNYHPGLIQLFCQELLKHLYKHAQNSLPPYGIEQKNVEAVYRKPEVRERIRERLEWTLTLDMRYQAIAWAMIEDQLEMQDSYAQAYPPRQVSKLVTYWWPQGFEGLDTSRLRGLLDEMTGLGVLVRNADGHYRLRSPNLVRLMGTGADIGNRLLELSEKQLPESFIADSHHAPLDDAAKYYSPLTYSQERSLNPMMSGVGLICASPALGLSRLNLALNRFIPTEMQEGAGVFVQLPEWLKSGQVLQKQLVQLKETHPDFERAVVYHRPADCSETSLARQVNTAIDFCQSDRSRDRWVRVFFILDPQMLWEWLTLPLGTREDLENRMDAVEFPRRWNFVGIRQRLSQHDKMHSDEQCEQILAATGGWPFLLDELFERCGRRDDDLRPFAQEIEIELREAGSKLRQDFIHALELEQDGVAYRVLEFIHQVQPVTSDDIPPELIPGKPTLTRLDCLRSIEYLRRMACLEEKGVDISVEKTVGTVLSFQ